MSRPALPEQNATFKGIVHGSLEYRAACELRNRVLRLPLGLDLYADDLAAEAGQSHFGLFDGAGGMLACVSVVRLEPHLARIRQMAVAPQQQGRGYGRSLMLALHTCLSEAEVYRVDLHARVTALGFYASLGYSTVGERYIEVGIPHQSMYRDLV